jgi:hypothetical protein
MKTLGTALLPALVAILWTGAFAPGQKEPAGAPVRFTEILLQDKYGYAYGIAAADLRGSGHLDLTSADTVNNKLYWFVNDGKGKFTRHLITGDEPGWLERHVIGDINGDGRPDVAIVKNKAEELIWFENPGRAQAGKPWKKHLIAAKFFRAYDVVLADLAGKGRLDLAASAWIGNHFAWFENPGRHGGDRKEWVRHVLDTGVGETRTIRAADFNGDGKMDLLGTATKGDLVLWYENPGQPGQKWTKHVIDDKSARPTHGQPVDLNKDGNMDVLMALGFYAPPDAKNSHQVVWYENLGKGKGWKRHVIGPLEQAFEAVAADLNGDGHLDVVATSYAPKGKVVWFENPGDPRKSPWKMHVLKDNWLHANQVIVADLNGDGRPDIIAVAERGANELRWWRNEGR